MNKLALQEISQNNYPFKKCKVALSIALTFTAIASNQTAHAEDNNQEYERIMVTGQKITRTLQETPASIAVFSSAKIEQQNLGEISEVLFETANVHSTGKAVSTFVVLMLLMCLDQEQVR